ncbi:MAG TPA: amidase [Acidimicrobiales bacterium]|nr:amidase [Acidimicrobiales bacterium]
MATFITRMEPEGAGGPLLAVKDLIDVAGVPTTAGCRAVADGAAPAGADATCLAGARAAGARIVGKANLFELAYGASGVNEWWGTPRNPLDPARVPGGSSSGSAVAVAVGDADVAYGSDTGGSIRVPSAFCGTAGLKTTHGRISLAGVRPLAPSLDTVGPMARDVAGLELGMTMLEPGFNPTADPAAVVGRLRVPAVPVDDVIDAAVDDALRRAGFDVVDIAVPGWPDAYRASVALLDWEAVRVNRRLMVEPRLRAKLGAAVAWRLRDAGRVSAADAEVARDYQKGWKARLASLFARVQILAGPTVGFFPPLLEEAAGHRYTALTNPVNLAGLPAAAIPVPSRSAFPASIQLIGPPQGEALVLATARVVEAACS